MAALSAEDRRALADVLADARSLGHIGPGPLEAQIDRSLALCRAVDPPSHGEIIDLGSGGGLPGLVMAAAWTSTTWALLEGRGLRAAFLTEAVKRLGWSDRVTVLADQAERVGRGPRRHRSPLVVARGFGSPAVTAECAAPLLRTGGFLLVTDPPGGDDSRWPPGAMAALGQVRSHALSEPVALQVFRQERPTPDRFPRRVGIPAKRPLF